MEYSKEQVRAVMISYLKEASTSSLQLADCRDFVCNHLMKGMRSQQTQSPSGHWLSERKSNTGRFMTKDLNVNLVSEESLQIHGVKGEEALQFRIVDKKTSTDKMMDF
uniref:Uncharacterized protein n=1 Tax=Ditylenchus dipsaci TaxID=166011 RepID=A0A915CRH1_9BILA